MEEINFCVFGKIKRLPRKAFAGNLRIHSKKCQYKGADDKRHRKGVHNFSGCFAEHP